MHRNEEDKNSIDLTKFMDSISIDVQKDYINIHFLTPYQLKLKGEIILEALPLFENVNDSRSPNWNRRVQEELEIFEFLKEKYVQQVGFSVYDQLTPQEGNSRLWQAVFYMGKGTKGRQIVIRLGLGYPHEFPRAQQESAERHVTSGDKCFGELARRWRTDGKFGIPHFLVILGYYYALEHKAHSIKL